jgi:hypothetical protein
VSYLGEEVRPFSFSTLRPLQLSSVNSTFGWNPSDLEPRASLKRDIELLDMGNKLTSLKFLFLLGQYEYFNIMTHSANVLIALLILVRADDDDDDTGDEGVASNYDQVQHAHGFTMGLSFAILFPLGAALIRLLRFRQVACFMVHGKYLPIHLLSQDLEWEYGWLWPVTEVLTRYIFVSFPQQLVSLTTFSGAHSMAIQSSAQLSSVCSLCNLLEVLFTITFTVPIQLLRFMELAIAGWEGSSSSLEQ